MILPDKDFYNAVERPGALKRVIYGDSVVENAVIELTLNGKFKRVLFKTLWEYLEQQKDVDKDIVKGKEYIFPRNDKILIQNVNLKKDEIVFVPFRYMMRHKYKGTIYQNWLTNEYPLGTTPSHSYVDVDVKNLEFIPKTPEEIQFVPTVKNDIFKVLPKYQVYYGEETKYKFFGVARALKDNRQHLFNIIPHKICRKTTIEYDGWVYDLEVPETHVFVANNVILHNTDSLFIEIPSKPSDIKEQIRLVNQTSKDINDLIVDYNKSFLLPRCGFSPDRNETKFKEELIIDSMLMLPVKKIYAYSQICSEAKVDENNNLISGKILEKPKIVKRSALGIKSDMINMTKEILTYLVDLALDNKVKRENKYEISIQQLKEFHTQFINHVKNLGFEHISVPVKYGKKMNVVYSMILYNKIIEQSFEPQSSGYLFYIKCSNPNLLKNLDRRLPEPEKLTAISVPPKYNKNKLLDGFKKYGLSIDTNKQWNLILSKVCLRVLDELKKLSKKSY